MVLIYLNNQQVDLLLNVVNDKIDNLALWDQRDQIYKLQNIRNLIYNDYDCYKNPNKNINNCLYKFEYDQSLNHVITWVYINKVPIQNNNIYQYENYLYSFIKGIKNYILIYDLVYLLDLCVTIDKCLDNTIKLDKDSFLEYKFYWLNYLSKNLERFQLYFKTIFNYKPNNSNLISNDDLEEIYNWSYLANIQSDYCTVQTNENLNNEIINYCFIYNYGYKYKIDFNLILIVDYLVSILNFQFTTLYVKEIDGSIKINVNTLYQESKALLSYRGLI